MAFPRSGAGWFAMLEGRFDDGGTHNGSEVVVWGGVMGDTSWFEALEQPWSKLLAEPIPGKPKIKQFHHSHVSGGLGEFRDYKQGERDMAVKAFRDVLISSQLVPVSFTVVLKDWDRLIVGPYRQIWGNAEQFAFLACVMAAFRMARTGNAPVALEFDAERLQGSRSDLIAAAQGLFPDQSVRVGFSACKDVFGLQAADLVAYESYLLSKQVIRNGDESPRPHFRRLLEGAPDAHGFIFREQEIRGLITVTDAALAGEGFVNAQSPGFQNVFYHFFRRDGV